MRSDDKMHTGCGRYPQMLRSLVAAVLSLGAGEALAQETSFLLINATGYPISQMAVSVVHAAMARKVNAATARPVAVTARTPNRLTKPVLSGAKTI